MKSVNIYDAELPREPEEQRRAGYSEYWLRFGPMIGAQKIGMTIVRLEAGERICPYHYEIGNEEWLIVLDGEPTLRTPEGERKLVRATSSSSRTGRRARMRCPGRRASR